MVRETREKAVAKLKDETMLGDLGPWLGRLSSSTVTPTTRCIGCVVKGVARDIIMPLSFSMAPAVMLREFFLELFPHHGCDPNPVLSVLTAVLLFLILTLFPMQGSVLLWPLEVTLPSLEDICSLKHPTIRFIPSSARPAFARALSSVLKEIVAVNSVAAWTKLLMLPNCVLPTSKRGGRHNKPISIDILCDMGLKGNLCELWHRAQTRATISTQSKKVLPNKRVDSAIALAKDGLYSKACQMLTSQGLAPDDDNTWNLLISKHPQGECPSNLPIPSTETVLPHDFNIIPVLRSFSKLTGAGPTVSEIVLEPGCANLLYHAWYLDDGVVAGSSTEILSWIHYATMRPRVNEGETQFIAITCCEMCLQIPAAWLTFLSSSKLAIACSKPKSVVINEIYGRLNTYLMRSISSAILTRIVPS
eukprot:Em0016g592a